MLNTFVCRVEINSSYIYIYIYMWRQKIDQTNNNNEKESQTDRGLTDQTDLLTSFQYWPRK